MQPRAVSAVHSRGSTGGQAVNSEHRDVKQREEGEKEAETGERLERKRRRKMGFGRGEAGSELREGDAELEAPD